MNASRIRFPGKINDMRGFTLIELMVTVVIIGILAAVALPNYSQYVVRSNRTTAQSEMMDIANREQQYLLANRAYGDTTALNYTTPSTISAKYTATVNTTADNIINSSCGLATDATVPSYVVVMTPITGGSQASDGTLYLSSTGVKCPNGKW